MTAEMFHLDPLGWAKELVVFMRTRPRSWTLGSVCYLYKKKGVTCDRSMCRPIALLRAASEIWSIIQNERLKPVLAQVMTPWQTGFREYMNTLDAAVTVDALIDTLPCSKLALGSLDMSRAFDTAIRKRIWARLLHIGCSMDWVRTLEEMHADTALASRSGKAQAEHVKVNKGVF